MKGRSWQTRNNWARNHRRNAITQTGPPPLPSKTGTTSLTLHNRDHLPYPRDKRLSIPHGLRRLLKGPHQSIPVHFLRVSHLVRYQQLSAHAAIGTLQPIQFDSSARKGASYYSKKCFVHQVFGVQILVLIPACSVRCRISVCFGCTFLRRDSPRNWIPRTLLLPARNPPQILSPAQI